VPPPLLPLLPPLPLLPLLPPLVPPPTASPLPPAQLPVTLGLQVKLSPQSMSVLQGSSQRYVHLLYVVVVHSGGVGAPASQSVLAGQAVAVPPEQAFDMHEWQTMPP